MFFIISGTFCFNEAMKVFSLKILIHILFLRPLVMLVFGINIRGRENIPCEDNYIMISNHNSHFDILLLFYLLPVRHIHKTHPVAAKEYFSKSKIVFKTVNFLFSPVWVSRGKLKSNIGFLDDLRENLGAGHNLIIFPEGTRGLPGQLQTFKGAVGKISEEHPEVPVIPVFLSGPERLLPKTSAIPVPMWNNVTVSPPQVFEEAGKVITRLLENTIREHDIKEKSIRHKRKAKRSYRMNSIAVLGIDGSGKSTLSRKLAIALSADTKITLLSDKLQYYKNGNPEYTLPFITEYSRQAIGRYAKHAKSLKHYKIPKLIELILRNSLIPKVRRWHKPEYLVLDGSPILNLTAWSILYKEDKFNDKVIEKAIRVLCNKGGEIPRTDSLYEDFPELKKLRKLGVRFHLPETVIFLDTDPGIAIGRINKRGERKQVHEKEEKLAKLQKAYLSICQVLIERFDIPTMIIAGNKSIESTSNTAINFINKAGKEENDHEFAKD